MTLMEQVSRSWSKTGVDGATICISEQLCLRRSKFLHQRATLPSMEQLSHSWSKIAFDGATFFISEQLCLRWSKIGVDGRSEEHTSELQSRGHLVCRLLLEKKNET